MVTLKFKREWRRAVIGDVKEMPGGVAAELIRRGIADRVDTRVVETAMIDTRTTERRRRPHAR
jgi:hypothetical protein